MKKYSILLSTLILAFCLMGLALDRLAPASPASAASETHPAVSRAGQVETASAPPAPAAQPVIFVAAGLVCGLFGLLAISPLLVGDPARKK